MAGIGDATIEYHFPARGGMKAINGTLSIPYITSIERTANVNLTEMPTLIYGASNNFCMDLGATEKITLKCERVNPFPYNDFSSDPAQWSNGKWYRHLESIFDRWQNFGVNGDGERTGGVTLRFVPADEELHPTIAANVFLAGSLGMSYSVQKLSFSLPFQLGNMQMKDVKLDTVMLTLETPTDSGTPLTLPKEVYKGIPTVISLPSEWESARGGMVFHGWLYNGNESSEIYDGRAYTFTESAKLVAKWAAAIDVVYSTEDDSCDVPEGASEVRIYAVGGGGGAGGSYSLTTDSYTPWFEYYVGGGGGSGEAVVYLTTVKSSVEKPSILRWTIGAGGSGGTSSNGSEATTIKYPTGGGGGGSTQVYLDGTLIVTAKGGSGGSAVSATNRKGTSTHGIGGQQYCAGGTHGQAGGDSSHALGAGFTADPNIGSNIGNPGKDVSAGNTTRPGGPSGGAAAFRYRFRTEDEAWHPSAGYYMSEGGDGEQYIIEDGKFTKTRYPTSGQCGGGGGAGLQENSLRAAPGSSGAVILVFFR